MQINLPALFQAYFGISSPVNEPGQPFTPQKGLTTPAQVATSVAGVPIYEQFTFTQPGVSDLNYTFPGWPLMSLDFAWIIKKTTVTDLPGTVKEYIGQDDVHIVLRGFLINHDTYAAPLDQKQALLAACGTCKTLKVTSGTLNALGVHYLAVENLEFPEVEGQLQVQPFTLEALSDYPYELVIKDAVAQKILTAQEQARAFILGK